MVDSATNVREYISNTRIGGLWLATGGLAATEGIRPMNRNSSTARPRASESNRLRDRDAFRSPVLAALPDFMFRLSSDGRYLDFKPAKDLEPYIPPSEFLGSKVDRFIDFGRETVFDADGKEIPKQDLYFLELENQQILDPYI